MVSWQSAVGTGFWVVGLALLLAAASYAYWQADERRTSYRSALSERGAQQAIFGGLILVGAGLTLQSSGPWQSALAGLLMAAAVFALARVANDAA